MAAGPSLAMASSIFTSGDPSRMAFGMIGPDGTPVYGPTAIYVAPTPNDPAEGPFVAPADVLLTDARYRSKQAATTEDPFVAVYGANVEFPKKGPYAVLATTKLVQRQAHGRDRAGPGLDREGRPDPARRRQGAEGPHRHGRERQGRHRLDRHA